MDVELQILKHLKRDPQPTMTIIDRYCQAYSDLFPEVRAYECFKYLHQGIVSPIARKSLPEIAKVVGINCSQSLHHFLANSPWSSQELEERRLAITLEALRGEKITVIIDETGDRKKGKKTDYVSRQYLGSIGKIDRGIVSVNAYGVYQNITFPLKKKVFKPKETLKEGDKYQTKIQLASEIIRELWELGFNIELVLADSLYGEASDFIETLERYKLAWGVVIRSNHGVWMPKGQTVRANKWCKFERIFSNQESETRYIREIIFGKRRKRTYWEVTTDPETMPQNSTSFIMTNIEKNPRHLKQELGNLYGLRTWVEYSFRQCKQELGWNDYRLTKFEEINKWWEIILSSYLMISLSSDTFLALNSSELKKVPSVRAKVDWTLHSQWNHQKGWKNVLNNFRLMIQPSLLFWSISPWLEVIPNEALFRGFRSLIESVNQCHPFLLSG
ncbi:MAG: IS701 family transposase [Waterburya sp.]